MDGCFCGSTISLSEGAPSLSRRVLRGTSPGMEAPCWASSLLSLSEQRGTCRVGGARTAPLRPQGFTASQCCLCKRKQLDPSASDPLLRSQEQKALKPSPAQHCRVGSGRSGGLTCGFRVGKCSRSLLVPCVSVTPSPPALPHLWLCPLEDPQVRPMEPPPQLSYVMSDSPAGKRETGGPGRGSSLGVSGQRTFFSSTALFSGCEWLEAVSSSPALLG